MHTITWLKKSNVTIARLNVSEKKDHNGHSSTILSLFVNNYFILIGLEKQSHSYVD